MANVDSNTYYMKGQILFCNKKKTKTKTKTKHSDFTKKLSEAVNINMIEFLNDNIFILFAWRVLQQTAGIHMGVICHPILADLFLSSDATYFIQRFLKKNQKEPDPLIYFLVFNATFSNISAISWRPVLVIAEAWVLGENHQPWASNW